MPGIEKIVEVKLDPAVIELARSTMRSANVGSLDDPRVQIVTADAMKWLREKPQRFDAVVVDLPDPDTPALGRLYSTEFYALVSRALAPGGLMVVQSGSPYSTPTAFWRTVSTVKAAGLRGTTSTCRRLATGASLWRAVATRRRGRYCHPTRRRCASSTSRYSTRDGLLP